MKKLFFSALVAVVAVGGALSANAITFYEEGSNDAIECSTPATVTCIDGLDLNKTYYEESALEGQVTEVNPLDFEDLTRIN